MFIKKENISLFKENLEKKANFDNLGHMFELLKDSKKGKMILYKKYSLIKRDYIK